MERKNGDEGPDDEELVVADILLQLPEIIFLSESRPLIPWRVKKKRSDIDPYLSTSPTTTCQNRLSPTTPLSFSHAESDRKCKRIKVLFPKKEEHSSKTVDESTHQRESLKSEIKNVKRSRNRVKALNTELKTKKQQCNIGMGMAKEAGVEIKSGEQVGIIPEPHPLQLFPCQPDRTFASVASTSGSDAVNPTGPYVTPKENLDLNLSLGISLNEDTAQLKSTAAAQARKNRLQIFKGGFIPKTACFIH